MKFNLFKPVFFLTTKNSSIDFLNIFVNLIRLSLNNVAVPYKEREIEKKYFSIGEVATMFKVAPSLIRYWEGEFDIINPKKDKKGNRRFTKEDIEKIRYIYQLVKVKGFTLQGAQEVIKKEQNYIFDKVTTIDKLHQIKKFLIEIRENIHVKSE